MILETERLFIRALKLDELEKYSEEISPFTDKFVTLSSNEIDENLRIILMDRVIRNVKNNSKDYLFFTLWLLIEKRFSLSVGSMMFKNKPDKEGKVEIGYGTHEEFQNRGFMTEAVGALCAWGFKSGKVKTIIAETAKDNPASFGVVKKNNFVKYDENDEFFYWKLSKNE